MKTSIKHLTNDRIIDQAIPRKVRIISQRIRPVKYNQTIKQDIRLNHNQYIIDKLLSHLDNS